MENKDVPSREITVEISPPRQPIDSSPASFVPWINSRNLSAYFIMQNEVTVQYWEYSLGALILFWS